jgi:hypothetical protein
MKTNRAARRLLKTRTLAVWLCIALFGAVEYCTLQSLFGTFHTPARQAAHVESLEAAGYTVADLFAASRY